MPISLEILKISSFPFRFRFLTNISSVILIFKTQYGSDSEIRGSQCGSTSKLFQNHSFSNVCMPITQEILKISSYPFRFWFLTNISSVIFIFKALYGSDSEMQGSQHGSVSELHRAGITAAGPECCAYSNTWAWGIHPPVHSHKHQELLCLKISDLTMCMSALNMKMQLTHTNRACLYRPWVFALICCLRAVLCTSNGVEYLISSASIDRLIVAGS